MLDEPICKSENSAAVIYTTRVILDALGSSLLFMQPASLDKSLLRDVQSPRYCIKNTNTGYKTIKHLYCRSGAILPRSDAVAYVTICLLTKFSISGLSD
jgi:hypothetical protein